MTPFVLSVCKLHVIEFRLKCNQAGNICLCIISKVNEFWPLMRCAVLEMQNKEKNIQSFTKSIS